MPTVVPRSIFFDERLNRNWVYIAVLREGGLQPCQRPRRSKIRSLFYFADPDEYYDAHNDYDCTGQEPPGIDSLPWRRLSTLSFDISRVE
jgi:hypothetical protein